MKKVVLKLSYSDDKIKSKVMQKASGLQGLESISIDPKDKKLTLTGDIDPVDVVGKLRKLCGVEIISVGPGKEPEKQKEPAKEGKKEEVKKDVKKEGGGGDKNQVPQVLKAVVAHQHPAAYGPMAAAQYYQQMQQHRLAVMGAPAPYPPHYSSMEEDPNSCVIC